MDDKIEELLVKKLDEGLSDFEERELNVWLEESRENTIIFKEMRKVRLWMDTGKSYNPDIELGFKKIKWRYRHERMIRWIRYTAVLIVCLTAGVLFWQYGSEPASEEKDLVFDDFSRPSTRQAFFVWADGTRVALNKGIKDNTKLIATNIHLATGNIYFGIYTLFIKVELPVIDVIALLVASLK